MELGVTEAVLEDLAHCGARERGFILASFLAPSPEADLHQKKGKEGHYTTFSNTSSN